ncbi:MAG: peptidoglycan DD-metalloendopeptidase family protein, partial [Bacillota bacterium]
MKQHDYPVTAKGGSLAELYVPERRIAFRVINFRRWRRALFSFILLLAIYGIYQMDNSMAGYVQRGVQYALKEADWRPALEALTGSGIWMESLQLTPTDKEKPSVQAIAPRESLSIPVSGKFTGKFGWLLSPVDGKQHFHSGIDIEAKPYSPVRAALDGTVAVISQDPTLGRSIKIDHGDGLTTFYANFNEILVSQGQQVKTGEIIGKLGVGKGTNQPKLHFEVREQNKPVD